MKRILIVFLLVLTLFLRNIILAQESDPRKTDLEKKIQEYQTKLNQLGQEKNTLSSQIQVMDTQIYLTGLKIEETQQKIVSTQKEIEILENRIGGLDSSLNQLSKQLLQRIAERYKTRQATMLDILLDSDDAQDFANRFKYYKTAQENNEKLLIQVQETKSNFEEQKKLREDKKTQLDTLTKTLAQQQISLNSQKTMKQHLLQVTKNDEATYQSLLAKVRSEYAAIQGIIAGSGTEVKMRDVKKGDTIASLITGSSCNSTGTHLHFIVQDGSTVNNPFGYLKSVDYTNDSGGDPFNPSGNWDWPVPPTIGFHQGYGETWAVKNTYAGNIYRFHNGIDISGSSNSVSAVADGELYKGSYAVGCTLSYVKLKHKDSSLSTLYLHVYPQ